MTLVIALAVVLAAIEALLRVCYALWAGGFTAEEARMLRRDGIEDVPRFWRELESLSKEQMQYHPYRWYALPPSVPGRYHRTDRLGFRNGTLRPGAAKIGFFGGSTTYSVRTDAAGSIPELVDAMLPDRQAVQAVNYGLGGYSSTNELMTFIEVLRRPDHGLRWAVFLDGVNEVNRYAERWQGEADAPFYEVMGYPWTGARYGLANEIGVPVTPRLALARAFDWLSDRVAHARRLARLSRGDVDYERAGRAVAEIYLRNVEDVRALAAVHGVVPIFFLQPTVFDLGRPSPREQAIRARVAARAIDAGRLQAEAYRAIRGDPRFAAFGIHDLTGALEDRVGEIFFDDCHLTTAGNALLARQIRQALPL